MSVGWTRSAGPNDRRRFRNFPQIPSVLVRPVPLDASDSPESAESSQPISQNIQAIHQPSSMNQSMASKPESLDETICYYDPDDMKSVFSDFPNNLETAKSSIASETAIGSWKPKSRPKPPPPKFRNVSLLPSDDKDVKDAAYVLALRDEKLRNQELRAYASELKDQNDAKCAEALKWREELQNTLKTRSNRVSQLEKTLAEYEGKREAEKRDRQEMRDKIETLKKKILDLRYENQILTQDKKRVVQNHFNLREEYDKLAMDIRNEYENRLEKKEGEIHRQKRNYRNLLRDNEEIKRLGRGEFRKAAELLQMGKLEKLMLMLCKHGQRPLLALEFEAQKLKSIQRENDEEEVVGFHLPNQENPPDNSEELIKIDPDETQIMTHHPERELQFDNKDKREDKEKHAERVNIKKFYEFDPFLVPKNLLINQKYFDFLPLMFTDLAVQYFALHFPYPLRLMHQEDKTTRQDSSRSSSSFFDIGNKNEALVALSKALDWIFRIREVHFWLKQEVQEFLEPELD